MAKAKEVEDPRHVARAEELARQDKVNEAMSAFAAENAREAAQALEDQAYYEQHGIRKIVGKP